ncbi:MBL fold metallo-hydrolase [uncultured Litoreibacter sp.]|uniref:MBL fold metallo-hydrolase n=1 Tax=uncultured Litoreibacter sp. TaxID=1392394 RepID=UPI002639CA8F|nr:MBL fold metallo-hydrolase [uncultured Litoreibacter sp.]
MSIIKSFSVGNGDTYYINHGSDNFTIIDCCLNDGNADDIIDEIKDKSAGKGITRFISTHPDEDHILGLGKLDDEISILNFYVVKNEATKPEVTKSFERYCELRDGDQAYYLYKGCKRRWMNDSNDERGSSGINILWPDRSNEHFQTALQEAKDGTAFNNLSLVACYSLQNGVSAMWLGDLETQFMEDILDDIELTKTDIVFAAHHGRKSGKIPDSWLDILEPEIIIIGEAPSRDLEYYSGYNTLTQNKCGDITMDCDERKVHFYVSSSDYGKRDWLDDEDKSTFDNYIGTLNL